MQTCENQSKRVNAHKTNKCTYTNTKVNKCTSEFNINDCTSKTIKLTNAALK